MSLTVHKTYAEEFASLLDAALPELGVAARLDRPGLEQRRCFSFQVPCPLAAVGSPLYVGVTQREITLEFIGAHLQLTNLQEAVTMIRELMEETVIVEKWYGPDVTDCAFVNVKALPPGLCKVKGVTRIVRQSWRGTYAADRNVD